MFTIDTNIPAPPKRTSCAAVTEIIEKLAPGESTLVPVSYRTAATNYAKRHGIKIVSKLEGDDKAHVRIWRAAE